MKKRRISVLTLALPVVLLLSGAASYFFIPSFHNGVNETFRVLTSGDESKVKTWVDQFGMAGPVALVLGMVLQMFMFVVPNAFVMAIAIVSYGPGWGALIALTGVFCSSSLGYILGRYLSPVTVNKLVRQSTQQKIKAFIDRYGFTAIAITRIASLSNDSLAIVAGLLKMDYKKYILATLAGTIPLIIMIAIFGRNGRLEKAILVVGLLSLLFFVLYVIIRKRIERKKAAGVGNEISPVKGPAEEVDSSKHDIFQYTSGDRNTGSR